jgi:hypothetical protein
LRIENHATVLVGLEVGMVEKDAVSKDFRKQVLGYGLTTAEIVYRRPDRHWRFSALAMNFEVVAGTNRILRRSPYLRICFAAPRADGWTFRHSR